MAKHLNDKVGSMEYDKLIAGITPPVKVASGIITKLSAAATYPRGTVLCRSSGTGGDGKLKILGTTASSNGNPYPDCILCDDEDIGTDADANVRRLCDGLLQRRRPDCGRGVHHHPGRQGRPA